VTHPDDDTLAAIALGDPAPSGAAEHARSCPQCAQTLAALRDTLTTLHAPAPELVAPPQSVWHAVESELDREADAAASAPASVATLPAAQPVAAQAATAPAPAGFTLVGTTTITYRDTQNVIHDATAKLYRKN